MPDLPKIKHGSSQMEGGRRVLSPEEVRALGIPTDPVLVISPVPRSPSKTSQKTSQTRTPTSLPRPKSGRAMSNYPKILKTQEASSMVSIWNEYLRLNKNDDGTATLEICQYETLAEVEYDEDGNELPLPTQVNGKDVIGVEHGYIVGGPLSCCGDRFLVFGPGEIDVATAWLKSQRFETDNEMIVALQEAVG